MREDKVSLHLGFLEVVIKLPRVSVHQSELRRLMYGQIYQIKSKGPTWQQQQVDGQRSIELAAVRLSLQITFIQADPAFLVENKAPGLCTAVAQA